MAQSKRVTIEDVARAAGVSRQTVSRAINDMDEISEETRARVLRIAEEMGYRPSAIARSLATRKTGTLGLVIPDVANPFFADLARGAEHVAYAEGHNVFLCNTNEDPQREVAVLRSLEEKRVDGIVICSSRLADERLRQIVARESAVVLVNRRPKLASDQRLGLVMLDDVRGGRLATQHLVEAGHRRIGFLGGSPHSRSRRSRAEGYRSTLAEAGISPDPEIVVTSSADVEGGREAATRLVSAHPELTALFCYNDLVAVGALQACADLGRSVPEEIAIIGFDDIRLAALVTPALTTCRVPRYDLGAQAMTLLLDEIEDCVGQPGCSPEGEILLRPELVVRASAPDQTA